jgi:hypothetical protein
MKKAILIALALFALAAPAAEASSTKLNKYPLSFRRAFIVSCMSNGGGGSYCICAMRWIQRRYTYAQFARIYRTQPVRLATIVQKAGYTCS